jgi:hypothetical protein
LHGPTQVEAQNHLNFFQMLLIENPFLLELVPDKPAKQARVSLVVRQLLPLPALALAMLNSG